MNKRPEWDNQFRLTDEEQYEAWQTAKAKRKAQGKCWQCAKLIAKCKCPNISHPKNDTTDTHKILLERQFPRVNFYPDQDGRDECPSCHGRGKHTRRNYATLSPSDDFEELCELCDGNGEIVIESW